MLRVALAMEQLGRLFIREASLSTNLPFKLNFMRRLSARTQGNVIDNNGSEDTSAQGVSMRKQLINYLENINPDLLKIDLKHCVKLNKSRPKHLWLIDEAAAKTFFSLIIDDLLKNMSLVLQINGGPGIMTEMLLKAGVKPLYVLDKEVCFQESLAALITKYRKADDDKVMLDTHLSAHKLLRSLQKKIEKRSWGKKSAMQVILAVPSAAPLAEILRHVVKNIGYAAFGRPIFYCAMYPSIWHKFINEENKSFRWTATKVLMCNFFDTEVLGTVPRQAFIPWEPHKFYPPGIKKITENDWEDIYIVKLEPKSDLFDYIDEDMLPLFYKFIRQLTWGKDPLYLIPKIESHFPNFGLKLIELNYGLGTRIKDLSSEDFLKIFTALEKWPDFDKTILSFDHGPKCPSSHATDDSSSSDED